MPPQLSCSPANTPEQRREAYACRYHAYLSSDGVPDCEGPHYSDGFDDRPNCTTYILRDKESGKVIGSIRPCLYTPDLSGLDIPVFGLHRETIKRHIGLDEVIVQSTHFVLSPDVRSIDLRPKLMLYREVVRACVEAWGNWIVTVVRPRHVTFYEKMGFAPIGSVYTHPVFKADAQLIAMRVTDLLQIVERRTVFQPMVDFPHPDPYYPVLRKTTAVGVLGSGPRAAPGAAPDPARM